MNMGLGVVGDPDIIFKRQNRFTFTIFKEGGSGGRAPRAIIPPFFVKTAELPKFTIDENELHYLNGIRYVTGKGRNEPITITYRDVATRVNNKIGKLRSWIGTFYNFNDRIRMHQSERQGYLSSAELAIYDGCGHYLDGWYLYDIIPTNSDFGSVAYESGDEIEISITLRYNHAFYLSNGECTEQYTPGECRGC